MTAMTLNKKILLQRREDNNGYGGGYTVISEKNVYASVQIPSISFQTKTESAGRKADLTAHLWRRDFDTDSYTHAVIGSVTYRINSVGASVNDLYVKLVMERN